MNVQLIYHLPNYRSSSVTDILCSLDNDQSGVTCLDRLHCPYAEEANYITLTVYVRYWYRVEKYFRQFYITEIGETHSIPPVTVDHVEGCAFSSQACYLWHRPQSSA